MESRFYQYGGQQQQQQQQRFSPPTSAASTPSRVTRSPSPFPPLTPSSISPPVLSSPLPFPSLLLLPISSLPVMLSLPAPKPRPFRQTPPPHTPPSLPPSLPLAPSSQQPHYHVSPNVQGVHHQQGARIVSYPQQQQSPSTSLHSASKGLLQQQTQQGYISQQQPSPASARLQSEHQHHQSSPGQHRPLEASFVYADGGTAPPQLRPTGDTAPQLATRQLQFQQGQQQQQHFSAQGPSTANTGGAGESSAVRSDWSGGGRGEFFDVPPSAASNEGVDAKYSGAQETAESPPGLPPPPGLSNKPPSEVIQPRIQRPVPLQGQMPPQQQGKGGGGGGAGGGVGGSAGGGASPEEGDAIRALSKDLGRFFRVAQRSSGATGVDVATGAATVTRSVQLNHTQQQLQQEHQHQQATVKSLPAIDWTIPPASPDKKPRSANNSSLDASHDADDRGISNKPIPVIALPQAAATAGETVTHTEERLPPSSPGGMVPSTADSSVVHTPSTPGRSPGMSAGGGGEGRQPSRFRSLYYKASATASGEGGGRGSKAGDGGDGGGEGGGGEGKGGASLPELSDSLSSSISAAPMTPRQSPGDGQTLEP